MSAMGTPENGFRKPRKEEIEAKSPMTVREAVTRYGDDWRLMIDGYQFIRRGHMEQITQDGWEASAMLEMERGERSRIRTGDIHGC